MHKPKHILLCALLVLLIVPVIASCDAGDEAAGAGRLVVEGWIEAGEFPVVKLSRSLQLTEEETAIGNLADYTERWAKVTVSDGEREEVMAGVARRDCLPPHLYTCNEIRGEAGRTYRLTIETHDGLRAEAITTIPRPVHIDSFSVARVVQGDSTVYQLYGYTVDRRMSKLFTRVVGRDAEYLSAYLGILDSTNIGAEGRIAINAGRSMFVNTLLNKEQDGNRSVSIKYTPYFRPTDVVAVKYAALDSTAYVYWRKFEDMADLSRNPFFPASTNLPSNVSGAIGYWFGYGSTVYVVDISRMREVKKDASTLFRREGER